MVGGALAVFGGNADGAATNELVQLELTKLRWERPKLMGKLPAPRQEHAAAAVGDELWVHGGSSDAGFFDDLWRLRRAADGQVEVVRVGDEGDLPRQEQTNDGKRSEWCEFLRAGDEVDIVPADPLAALASFGEECSVVAFTRACRPPGAEPVVADRI